MIDVYLNVYLRVCRNTFFEYEPDRPNRTIYSLSHPFRRKKHLLLYLLKLQYSKNKKMLRNNAVS